jgi:hypothetical protein
VALEDIKRRVYMHILRFLFFRIGFFKPGLLPWCARKPLDWSQPFLSAACKGNFTQVIAKKYPRGQKSQKKQNYLESLNGSWQER